VLRKKKSKVLIPTSSILFLIAKVVKIGLNRTVPDLHPVWLVQKTAPQENRYKNVKTGFEPEKTDNPAGLEGLAV
jgi:hypothetical protein